MGACEFVMRLLARVTGESIEEEGGAMHGGIKLCVCLLLQDLLQSFARGGKTL